jgi:DNA-binding transcriptional LysR family regulator
VPLTRKVGRTVELSDAGRALASASIDVARALSLAHASVETALNLTDRLVRVCAFHSAAATFFPLLTAGANSPGFPQLECTDEDVEGRSFPALTAVYDIVIAHRMTHSADWPSDLAVLPLFREPLDVAMHASHPLASLKSLSPADLRSASWVSTRRGFSPAEMLEAVSATTGDQPRVVHRINDFSTTLAILSQREHVAFVPRYTVRLDLAPEIVLRPLDGVQTTRSVDLLVRPDRIAHNAVGVVARTLQEIALAMVAARKP